MSSQTQSADTVKHRKIIHIDMDAFFASVEQRDSRQYQGKPLIVGGAPDSRGVVAACSYEARAFGVRSAMASSQAARLCPQAIFVKPRFEVYREVSQQIQAIFKSVTALVEPLSLDEAYLDVTACHHFAGSATLIAKDIKKCIKQQTQLIASAGVSYNKFLAKIASDMDKPDGLYVIKPEQGAAFVEQLPIARFFGIGKATEAKMHRAGIFTGADLKAYSKEELLARFGKVGEYYYQIARAIDERPVNNVRRRKSISTETTFADDMYDLNKMHSKLVDLAADVSGILKQKKLFAQTLIIKVKYADFQQVTRSLTTAQPFQSLSSIDGELLALLQKTQAGTKKVRLLGVGVSNLLSQEDYAVTDEQLSLFTNMSFGEEDDSKYDAGNR